MLTIEQIRQYLHDRNLSIVAKESGINYQTIRVIKRDENANPHYRTLEKLSNYLTGNDR